MFLPYDRGFLLHTSSLAIMVASGNEFWQAGGNEPAMEAEWRGR